MQRWKESKFQSTENGLIASRNENEVAVSSRIVCSLVGAFYHHHIPLHIKGDLIDLGCGKAPLFGVYKRHSNSQQFLDVEDRLEHARLDYQASLNESLTVVRRSFDSAILSDVLEHLERPEVALKSIRGILNEKGVLLMTVPFLYGIHEAPNDYRRFTMYGLKSELSRAGFTKIEIYELGGVISVLVTLTAKLLDRCFGINSMPVKTLMVLYNIITKIPLVKLIDQRTAKTFPLEYGVICYRD